MLHISKAEAIAVAIFVTRMGEESMLVTEKITKHGILWTPPANLLVSGVKGQKWREKHQTHRTCLNLP